MSNPIKVLILENKISDFRLMREQLVKSFGENINISPSAKSGADIKFENWTELLSDLKIRKFIEVAAFCSPFDLIIIDLNLVSTGDGIGGEFFEFLRNNNIPRKTILLVSRQGTPGSIQIDKDNDEYFLSRMREGGYFLSELVKFIANQFLIPVLKKTQLELFDDMAWPAGGERKRFSELRNELGFWPAVHHWRKRADEFIFRKIDMAIIGIFYLLIIVTTVSAAWNIFSEFSPINIGMSNKKVEHVDQSKYDSTHTKGISIGDKNLTLSMRSSEQEMLEKEDTIILTKAEHIFLYLLPIFIIFGFYNYYKTNARVYLLGGYSKNIDEVESTRGMNLTKVLFISSIISYVVIKVISEIFKKDNDLTTDSKLIKLGGAGLLLLILMGYFIFLNSHSKTDKVKTGH